MPGFLLAFLSLALSLMCAPAYAQFLPANAETDFYFAHITYGGSDAERWTTEFRLMNLNNFPVTGKLWFISPSGGPLTVDFGGVSGSEFPLSIPPYGSSRFEITVPSPVPNSGFVKASFDSPVQATAEFRVWRNGVFGNGAGVEGISPHKRFRAYADWFTGVAMANPNPVPVSCEGRFVNGQGFLVSQTTISLPQFNQKAFNIGNLLSLSQNSVGSFYIDCTEPIVSLFIAGNIKGVTSSLPAGALDLPRNHSADIQRIFKHLVKTLNSTPDGDLAVGQPELLIGTGLILNAVAEPGRNRITIWLAVAELLSDSPSELAYVIAHELGHIYQASRGLRFNPYNSELDADTFAIIAAFWAGYDAYAAAGAQGKLAMVTKHASINAQRYDDLNDPHTSFTNRMIQMYGLIESLCNNPDWDAFCTQTRNLFHPHMPTPLRDTEPEVSQARSEAPVR